MTTSNAQPRHRRRGRVLLVAALVAAAVCVGAYQYLTSDARVRRIVEHELQRYAPGLVTVGSAQFSLFGSTVLHDVVIHSVNHDPAHPAPNLLTCPRIELMHDPFRAVLGAPKIDALVADAPICTILHVRRDSQSSLASVMKTIVDAAPTQAGAVPFIELRHACVRVLDRGDDGDREVGELRLNVRGRESASEPGQYDVDWESIPSGSGASPECGHAQIDMHTGTLRNIQGGLPQMNLEAVLLAVNARLKGAGAWAELLGIGGKVHARDFELTNNEEADTRSATIDLTDITLSIPCDKLESSDSHQTRYVRFEKVVGSAVVTGHHIDVTFDGVFHGRPCHLNGTLTWQDDPESWMDMGFDLHVRVAGLTMPKVDDPDHPEETRFIAAHPSIARIYDEFSPSGKADVELSFTRAPGHGKPVRLRDTRLTLQDGSIVPRALPYRIDDLEGEIVLSEDSAAIHELRGKHGDSTITIHADFDAPINTGRAEVVIDAKQLPLDEELAKLMPKDYRLAWEQSGASGTVDVEVDAKREPPADGRAAVWHATKTLTFDDLSAVFKAFPYPLKHLGGRLIIDDDRVVIDQIAASDHKSSLQAHGTLTLSEGNVSAMDVTLRGKGLEVNDALLDALPKSIKATVADFHPTGRFDLETRLTGKGNDPKLHYLTRITLRGNTIQHEALPIAISDVLGEIIVDGDTATLHDVTGRHGTAVVRANGVVHSPSTGLPADLVIECSRVRPTDDIYAALPPAWRAAVEGWDIDGEADLTVHVGIAGGDSGIATTTATVDLDGATIRPPRFPAAIENVRGTIHVSETGVRAPKLTGRYGAAELSGSIDYTFDKSGPGQALIELHATDLALDERIGAILSERTRASWNQWHPGGTIDLDLDQLRFRAERPDQSPTWTASGHAKLRDVSFDGGAGIDRAVGDVTFTGSVCDRSGGLTLSGNIDLAGVRVHERKLEAVTGSWSLLRAANGMGRFAIKDINANLYDGSLIASVVLNLDPGATHYEVATDLREADLAPLLKPDARQRDDETTDGRADIQFELMGTAGDLASRRGQGTVHVVGKDIYRMPIVLSMIQVLNLAMPIRSSFQALESGGYLVGDTISLTDARISGEGVMLVGQGTVALSNLAADLVFVSVNPSKWGRVPVLNDLLDEVSRQVVALGVSGTLHDPIVRIRPFHGLAEELRTIFVKQKPKNRQPDGQ